MKHKKTEYTSAEAAKILKVDVRTVLYHRKRLQMGTHWWFNEKREFRCTPEAIEILKARPTRGKYIRKKS
jgi:hypothetical protein